MKQIVKLKGSRNVEYYKKGIRSKEDKVRRK